jgi:hypothetical protein
MQNAVVNKSESDSQAMLKKFIESNTIVNDYQSFVDANSGEYTTFKFWSIQYYTYMYLLNLSPE